MSGENDNKVIEVAKKDNVGIEIPLDFTDFKEHLDIHNNKRILFSGAFGSGKTYFLKKFFKDEEIQDEYEVIHLHPTRYQVSSNENILDLIKLDILTETLTVKGKGMQDRNNKVKNSPIFRGLVSIGKETKYKNIIDILKDVSIITENFILKRFTNSYEGKKVVLVVDDLDRMDPQHIFRIMNIFSAFVGEDESETFASKLGFEKVIFVAHNENLKSIFSHFYGKNTDITGYIDKFYSIGIFEHNGLTYDLYDKKIRDILYNKLNEVTGDKAFKNSGEFVDEMITILFLVQKSISLRKLKALLEENEPYKKRLGNVGGIHVGNVRTVLKFIEMLILLIGEKKLLVECVKNLDVKNTLSRSLNFFVEDRISQINYTLFYWVIEPYYGNQRKKQRPYYPFKNNEAENVESINFNGIKFTKNTLDQKSNDANLELFKQLMLEILNNIHEK